MKCCSLCSHFGMDVQQFIFCKKRQCFEPGVECRGYVKDDLVLPILVSLCQVIVDGQFDLSGDWCVTRETCVHVLKQLCMQWSDH